MQTAINLNQLPQIVTAIGGLGTAAFGIVDTSKVLGSFGPNRIGFGGVKKTVTSLTPGAAKNALTQAKILATLRSNWFNGTDLAGQKAIAKSLIKQYLTEDNAVEVAAATGVDAGILKAVATKIAAGTALATSESDVYARFDLILTALLDETYQIADNVYRNWTRALAGAVAVALAVVGGFTVHPEFQWATFGQSVLVGLLATPLAPIAKDLSTALATAVNTMQRVKK